MITAEVVKELRERTGAGMMDCKRALSSADGDMEKAIEILREKGLAAAAKKSGRVASEGLVETYISEDGKYGAVVEVNCETDFVGKNQDFIDFVKNVAKQAALSKAKDVEELLSEKYIAGEGTVKDILTELIAKIGENMNLRRFERFVKEDKGIIKDYIHGGGRIGVMLQLSSDSEANLDELAKDIAMQIAAANPQYISKDEVTEDVVEKEREIYKVQAMNEGKPENIAEKMVIGRLQKFFKEVCLIEQLWIRDQDYTIGKLVEEKSKQSSSKITIKKFARFEKGEGIEKKSEDFAAEVQAQINRS
ncbi:elongation factor Ts [Oxobacter pfennigii]|uniref:Elongation factor Ts n=1 Tax=Oxobacter pfennigii TaxID=36849 RepID=A0A0P8WZK4_9CLOT|nr:translation elongation factor Ts [Oxobacter pfennigii]KPU43917.1 elongation factor Ts [Oxobacter pfennigii]